MDKHVLDQTTRSSGPVHSDEVFAGHMKQQQRQPGLTERAGATTRKRRHQEDDAPRRRPGRPRLSAAQPPPQQQQPEKQAIGESRPEICAITSEPVNTRAIADLASRRAAGFLRLPGSNMTVREIAFYFLQCCTRTATYADGSEIGVLPVIWRESACAREFGIKTRRFSGFKSFLDDEEAGGAHGERFRALQKAEVPACVLGKSFFSVAKLLRWTARTGVRGIDIDQVNAHFNTQALRHPSARWLNQYRARRESTLREIGATLPDDVGAAEDKRDAAKDLFIILGYGGGIDKWCRQHGVERRRLPALVEDFAREQQALRKEDVLHNRELHRAAMASGHERPDVKTQATLNLRG